jgi:hypothetical protein
MQIPMLMRCLIIPYALQLNESTITTHGKPSCMEGDEKGVFRLLYEHRIPMPMSYISDHASTVFELNYQWQDNVGLSSVSHGSEIKGAGQAALVPC